MSIKYQDLKIYQKSIEIVGMFRLLNESSASGLHLENDTVSDIKVPKQPKEFTPPETNIAPENGWLEY